MYMGLTDTLVATAARYADAPALWAEGEQYTYGELFERARRLAAVLSKRPEPFCLLYCRTNATPDVAMLASVLAGKVFVPLCPTSPLRFCQEVLERLGPATYIFDSGDYARERVLLDGAPAGSTPLTIWATGRRPADLQLHDVVENSGPGPPNTHADHPDAYLMFTSCRTGVP